ncbi:hypothetical protein CDL15_Pgr014770 [Punica granatum]|uniref:Uncharacterized protein n=1 Tax=Punica granatum TaxID=22663 RepID=A0A218XZI8_PUNGR|nr:hypothetical protein CDL15_Pgr014770 [Punica granatum]
MSSSSFSFSLTYHHYPLTILSCHSQPPILIHQPYHYHQHHHHFFISYRPKARPQPQQDQEEEEGEEDEDDDAISRGFHRARRKALELKASR